MKGGEVLSHYFEMTSLERDIKDDKSFATKADTESERAIVSVIEKAFPDHGFLGEEGTDIRPDAEYRWVIDPLDGTNNFVNGIPLFAISIAATVNGVPVISVVYNPITRSLYAAEKGKGATYNGKPVRVSDQKPEMGIITFGPGSKVKDLLNELMSGTERASFKSKRYLGATALELGYVARGGTEAYVCLGLKKWDYAAGVLLIQEAGGTVTDFSGGEWNLDIPFFIASNGVAHQAALALVKPFLDRI